MSQIVDVVLLEQKIIRHSNAYYEGRQEIPDSEFDALVDQLREASPKSKVLSMIGWGYAVDDKQKVAHLGSSVGSLSKKKFPEECETRGRVISPKLDGGSIVLYFKNTVLMDALTRGDGEKGMVCTRKMKYLLPNVRVTEPGLISIRGEVFIPNSYHDTLIKRGIPNPRNYANGIINRIGAGEDIKMLRFIPYSVRIYNQVLTKRQMFEKLASWGFKRIPFVSGDDIKSVDDLNSLYKKWSTSLPIDGLVLTQDHTITASKIEANAFSIDEASIAYKFESERAQVEVGRVEPQAGDTGRVVPVIKLKESIFLSGANITFLTAHNYTQVKEKGIGEGAIITIERANEVIPYLVSVDKPGAVILPTRCPDCDAALEWKNMDIYCPNQLCPTKQYAITKCILETCGIPDGFGDKMLKKWINGQTSEEIVNFWCQEAKTAPASDFHLVPNGHYDKLSFRLKSNVHSKFSKGFTYQEFWKMVRIPGLGDSHAKKLRNTNPLDFIPQGNEKLSDIVNGICTKLKLPINVSEELYRTFDFWCALAEVLTFTKPLQTKNTLMKIVVTGPVSMPRKDFEKYLADNGVELTETLNKEVKYLVCNQPSGSAKTQKATKLGIPIITEDGLLNMLGLD
jgi:DNA ligase (NAD+)